MILRREPGHKDMVSPLARIRFAVRVFLYPHALMNILSSIQEARTCLAERDALFAATLISHEHRIEVIDDALLELEEAESMLTQVMGYEE